LAVVFPDAVMDGSAFVCPTVIVVEAVPVMAFVAVKVTLYVPASPLTGCHVKVPEVFVPFAVKLASFPEGSADVSAVKDAIASPSGSLAVTPKVTVPPSLPFAVPGAVTTGARSTLFTVTSVVAASVPPFPSSPVNVTE
jgi:hypothetical protein